MKYLILTVAVVLVLFAASCTQRTCPTYTKGATELPQEEGEETKTEVANI